MLSFDHCLRDISARNDICLPLFLIKVQRASGPPLLLAYLKITVAGEPMDVEVERKLNFTCAMSRILQHQSPDRASMLVPLSSGQRSHDAHAHRLRTTPD